MFAVPRKHKLTRGESLTHRRTVVSTPVLVVAQDISLPPGPTGTSLDQPAISRPLLVALQIGLDKGFRPAARSNGDK